MKKKVMRLGLVAVVFALGTNILSAQTFNDGATHNISGPATDVNVINGTTVNVLPGAAVSGSNGGRTGISAFGDGTMVNVTGGSVTGGADLNGIGGEAVFLGRGASLTVTDGVITGGAAGNATLSGIGGDAIFVSAERSTLVFESGTITGGFAGQTSGIAGHAMFVAIPSRSAPFLPGDPVPPIAGDSTLVINGGTFTGGSTGGIARDAIILIGISPVLPPFDQFLLPQFGSLTTTITGGTFAGGTDLSNGPFDGDSLVLSGGSLFLTVTGGDFQDPIRLGLGNNSSASFFGDLSYAGGFLRGSLSNGDAISTEVTIGQGVTIERFDDHITFSTTAVPEPTTIASLGFGLIVGAGVLLRRKRTA